MGTLAEGTYGTVGCGPAFSGGCLGAFWVNNSVSYENSFGPVSFGAQYSVEPVGPAASTAQRRRELRGGPLYLGAATRARTTAAPTSAGPRSPPPTTSASSSSTAATARPGRRQDQPQERRGGLTAAGRRGQVIASYNVQDQSGVRVEQLLSLGYKYFLSKRTNVFAVVANDSKAPARHQQVGLRARRVPQLLSRER
jgi:predicted porin